MLKADFKPRWLYQTTAPSLGDEYAKAIGPENTEGIIFAISHAPQAQTPGNAEFVKKYGEMFGGLPAEDAADAYGPPRCSRPPWRRSATSTIKPQWPTGSAPTPSRRFSAT